MEGDSAEEELVVVSGYVEAERLVVVKCSAEVEGEALRDEMTQRASGIALYSQHSTAHLRLRVREEAAL